MLFDIPELPRDHTILRHRVLDSIPAMPQAEEWIRDIFDGDRRKLRAFILKHRKNGNITKIFLQESQHLFSGTWTDPRGVMVAATCIFVGRNIKIYGTNVTTEHGYITIETGKRSSKKLLPMNIGHYYDNHYQSLEVV